MTFSILDAQGIRPLLALHCLADHGQAIAAHIRIGDGGVSATVVTPAATVIVSFGAESRQAYSFAGAVDVRRLACIAYQVICQSFRTGDDICITIEDDALQFSVGGTRYAPLPCLDVSMVDRRRLLADLLLAPRCQAVGQYPETTLNAVRQIAGTTDLELFCRLPDEAFSISDAAALDLLLARQPAIHWSDHVLAVIQPPNH